MQVGAPVVRDEGTGAGQRARVGGDAVPVRELARQCRVEGGLGMQDARALSHRLEPLGRDARVVLERDADRLLERHALHELQRKLTSQQRKGLQQLLLLGAAQDRAGVGPGRRRRRTPRPHTAAPRTATTRRGRRAEGGATLRVPLTDKRRRVNELTAHDGRGRALP